MLVRCLAELVAAVAPEGQWFTLKAHPIGDGQWMVQLFDQPGEKALSDAVTTDYVSVVALAQALDQTKHACELPDSLDVNEPADADSATRLVLQLLGKVYPWRLFVSHLTRNGFQPCWIDWLIHDNSVVLAVYEALDKDGRWQPNTNKELIPPTVIDDLAKGVALVHHLRALNDQVYIKPELPPAPVKIDHNILCQTAWQLIGQLTTQTATA